MNELSVIYRACDKETTNKNEFNICRPGWFNKINCFNSFIKSFNNVKPFIYIIFDGNSISKFGIHIRKTLQNYQGEHEICWIDYKDNKKSLSECYNVAEKLDTKYIYFLEDDYLHLANAGEVLVDGLRSLSQYGPITLYDHLDRYIRGDDVTLGKEWILLTKYCHWRTAESTTCTWAASKEFFMKYKEKLKDLLTQDRLFFREILKDGFRLFSSIPGYSTHVNKAFSSPLINWEKINNENNID